MVKELLHREMPQLLSAFAQTLRDMLSQDNAPPIQLQKLVESLESYVHDVSVG